MSRSDSWSFHLYLEESYIRPAGDAFEVVALFRYDLDPAGLTGDSALAILPIHAADASLPALQRAADSLASALARGEPLLKTYTFGM